MDDHQAHRHRDDAGLMMLMGGLLLAPLAWFVDLQASYATVKWACRHGRRDVLLLFPVGSLSLVALAGWMSWSAWTKLRGASADGGTIENRSCFLAVIGVGLAVLFGLLILSSVLPRSVLSPCQ